MAASTPSTTPLLVCLHYLGGSAREWTAVFDRLGPAVRGLALDLPGFGDAAFDPGLNVEGMTSRVSERLRGELHGPWWLIGHSMGAKVALALAQRAEKGDPGLAGLAGLIVISGSPPGPEPMSEDKRAAMVAWIDADPSVRRQKAREFIAANAGDPLDPAVEAEAVADVLRTNPAAWTAWLMGGSREDWCRTIGVLRTRALILSGTADADLGPVAQDALMAPHFATHDHVAIDRAGHLLPRERPDAVAAHIAAFMTRAGPAQKAEAGVAGAYCELIGSARVNARLRAALMQRAEIDDPAYQPACLDPVELAILRAVCRRVLPHPAFIDIAARIDQRLASGSGDGWRFAKLPADHLAYGSALRTLDALARRQLGRPFVTAATADQDMLLHVIDDGHFDDSGEGFDRERMTLWFEDLRADAVRIYLAHPSALAALGFSGIGAGGDDPGQLSGFQNIGIGQRDPWEPAAGATM